MSAQEASSVLSMGTTRKYDIPLAHLDYKYIEECNDVKYLEKILKILRSGEEGKYPAMEKQCEEKIEKLNPVSRILRKEVPIKKINDIDREEGHTLQKDIQSWTTDMKTAEDSMNGSTEFDDNSLPPIRSGVISLSGEPVRSDGKDKAKKKATMPRSYKEWEKVDIEKELEAADNEKPKEKSKSATQPVIENVIDSTGMSEREKEMKANREKDKGNEAFRSGDYQEAISYYSRSISLQPSPPSYNNRALAYLKTKEWLKAESDCNKVLSWEPKNIKALLRRGSARMGKKSFSDALTDFEYVLELEPNNKRAQELIRDLKKEEAKYEAEKKERKEKGRRMVIEEVEDEESADEEIVVEEEKSFEEKKKSVSALSEEVNKNKTKVTEIIEAEDKPMVNGFHKPSKQKSDSKDIWEEEDAPQKDPQGFTTLRTKPDEKENLTESESTQELPSQSPVSQSETSRPTPQEIENFENENIANASAENTRVEVGAGDKSGSGEPVNVVMEKPPEEVAMVRPVYIKHPLPGPIAKLREDGNQLFREGQYGDAIQKYTEALNKLNKEKSDQVVNKSLIHSNRAACHLKTGDCATAVKDCTTSLELVPHSIKPLLRRGNAFEMIENYRKAYIDYKHVLYIDNTVDMAHQGSSRCQSHLQEVDGRQWREKLPKINSVLPWEVPEIRTPEEASRGTTLSSVSSSQKSSPSPSALSSQTSSASSSSTSSSKTPTELPKVKEESFEDVKSRGNEHVKKSEFRLAIECYSRCVELDSKQAVSYTNRALCYIRINEPEKAEEDCTKALTMEKDNVKALFRRAQAKKMLKRYKDSLTDLMHLLRVDPKNAAAKREVDLVKDYWREELKSRPPQSSSSNANGDAAKSANKDKASKIKAQTSSHQPSAQASSKSNVPGPKQQEVSKSEEKSDSKKGKQKTRKRMVIEEVESEENQQAGKEDTTNKTQKPSNQQEAKKTTHSQDSGAKSKQTGSSVNQSAGSKSKQAEPSSPQEPTSKKKGKKNKSTVGQTSSTKSSSSSSVATENNSPSLSSSSTPVSNNKASQKTGVKVTSAGLPVVPPTAPKLEKATPYEFIQAWNSLKNVTDVQPYADLLRQLPPKDLPQVISNKLDGSMLNKITKCVAEKFITQGDTDLSYNILHHLTKVPRFSTISMFLSAAEKKDIQTVISSLQKSSSSLYSNTELSSLKKDYGV